MTLAGETGRPEVGLRAGADPLARHAGSDPLRRDPWPSVPSAGMASPITIFGSHKFCSCCDQSNRIPGVQQLGATHAQDISSGLHRYFQRPQTTPPGYLADSRVVTPARRLVAERDVPVVVPPSRSGSVRSRLGRFEFAAPIIPTTSMFHQLRWLVPNDPRIMPRHDIRCMTSEMSLSQESATTKATGRPVPVERSLRRVAPPTG